jgi:tetratricopeptide (TPR) repeat protein
MFSRISSRIAATALATALVLPCSAGPQGSAERSAGTAAAKPNPRRARSALERGDKAAALGQWEEALADFEEASQFAPQNLEMARKREVARARAVRGHEDSAERLALEGQVTAAQAELRAALKLDPGNDVVSERLAQLGTLPEVKAQSGPVLGGPARLEPRPGKHSFNIRGDTRSAFEEVAAAFGVIAAFDPDVTSRPVRLRVDDVDFATMMGLVGTETGTFWSPVDAKTFFVAPSTAQKRRDLAPTVEQTFVLSDTASPEEATDTLRALREITGAGHIQLDTRTRSITVRDKPETVALAGELMRQLGQARGEVMLEIEILEVNRNRSLQTGITPPTQGTVYTVSPTQAASLEQALAANDIAAAVAILQQIFGAAAALNGLSASQLSSAITSGQVGLGTAFPPVVAIGGGKSIFLLSLPQTTAVNFYQTLTRVRSGQRMLMRAQDGKPATFFVGQRYPVTLAVLTTGTGTNIPTIGGSTANFFTESDFPVGTKPVALTGGNFTSTSGGILDDLAVVNQTDHSVTVLLNQGSGQFTQAAGSPIVLAATETGSVAIANGVFRENLGILDLVIANQTSNNLSVLEGDGVGGFTEAPGSAIAVGAGPSAITAGQFNSKIDNHLDLAVANATDNTITILLGDGNGGLAAAPGSPFHLATGEQGPVALLTGDFNGDGLADLVVVNQSTNNVAILLGQGDGTFLEVTGSPITVGAAPVAIASADFTADGVPDLAVANQGDNTVTVLLNSGNGTATFTAAQGSPLTTGRAPSGVAAVSVGIFAALAVTNRDDNTISVFLGDGAGGFTPVTGTPLALATGVSGPTATIAANLSGRGDADLAFTDEGSNQASVILVPANFVPSGASLQQPYPASDYVDLGLKVKATPVVHPNDEVTLHLEFEIRALAGAAANGIPVLSNRTIDQTVRLKENETAMVVHLLDYGETRSILGLPGLMSVPVLTQNEVQPQETEMLLFVTPRLLRLPPHAVRPLYAGRGDTSTRGEGSVPARAVETPPVPPSPQPLQPGPPRQQPPQQQQQPQTQPNPQM